MKRLIVPMIAVFLLCSGSAAARDYGMSVRTGSQGLGVEGAIGLKDWVTLRGGLYGGGVSYDFEEGGNDYNGDLTVGGLGVLADFFPTHGKFRLTAGMFTNNNEIEFDTTPTSPIELGGSTYSPAEIGRLDGKVDFNSSAPYFGIGWGNTAEGQGRLGFLFDVGALIQGSPELSLVRSSTIIVPGLDQDIQLELDEIEDDVESLEFWPVISFGLAIRF